MNLESSSSNVCMSNINTIELECRKEAKALCKKMTRFFELITIPSASVVAKVAAVDHNMIQSGGGGITQELLSLVTRLAQNLKSLIRIGLSAALHLVRTFYTFLGFFFTFYNKERTIVSNKSYSCFFCYYIKGTRYWN